MAYKNKADQAAAARCHYLRNASAVKRRAHDFKRKHKLSLRFLAIRAKEKPCADCGIQYPHYVMDFDHVSGSKVANVSDLISSGVPARKIVTEIEKCEVVCANCHRIRTWSRRKELRVTAQTAQESSEDFCRNDGYGSDPWW